MHLHIFINSESNILAIIFYRKARGHIIIFILHNIKQLVILLYIWLYSFINKYA